VSREDNLRAIINKALGKDASIMACQLCGQKNRIDTIKMLFEARRPKCGKCHGFLRGPQWDSTEGGPPQGGQQ
jgi:hypothetical protein